MSPDGQVMTLLVSDDGPFESLAKLADGCRELVREEFIQAAHPRAREPLDRLGWRGVYVESTLQRWRIPDAVPRRVLTCPEFDQEVSTIAEDDRMALGAALRSIEDGEDLTPLLSKWATRVHAKRRDRFLADWQLHHIHLRPGSSDLLFIHFTRQNAYVVALRPHDSWAEHELAHRIQRHWPGLIFTGTLAAFRPMQTATDQELKSAQQAGLYVIFPDEQGMAIVGRGLTASGHPIDLIDAANNLEHALWALERGEILEVEDPRTWRPCLTQDLGHLGLWNSQEEQIKWLAGLWPFPA